MITSFETILINVEKLFQIIMFLIRFHQADNEK